MEDILEKKHAIFITEFDRYVVEHPEFVAQIQANSQIVLQVEGDSNYNEWSHKLAKRQREPGQPVVYIRIKGLKPVKKKVLPGRCVLRCITIQSVEKIYPSGFGENSLL